jgi:hypothetical protein
MTRIGGNKLHIPHIDVGRPAQARPRPTGRDRLSEPDVGPPVSEVPEWIPGERWMWTKEKWAPKEPHRRPTTAGGESEAPPGRQKIISQV